MGREERKERRKSDEREGEEVDGKERAVRGEQGGGEGNVCLHDRFTGVADAAFATEAASVRHVEK